MLALLPASDAPLAARLAIPFACALAALTLHVNSDELPPSTLHVAASLGTLLVSAYLWMSEDAPALSGALLYAWLAIYAAYFFPIRQAVFQLVLMCAAYLAVLVATVPADVVIASWITLAGGARPDRRRAADRARRRDAARAQPVRGGSHRPAHAAQEPAGARPGDRRAARGRAPGRNGR